MYNYSIILAHSLSISNFDCHCIAIFIHNLLPLHMHENMRTNLNNLDESGPLYSYKMLDSPSMPSIHSNLGYILPYHWISNSQKNKVTTIWTCFGSLLSLYPYCCSMFIYSIVFFRMLGRKMYALVPFRYKNTSGINLVETQLSKAPRGSL